MWHHTLRSLSRLPALLLAATPALASADEPPSWVFFSDRVEVRSADLDARASELAPRALARRQRARGDHGVDARDLAPASARVAAVLATGARLRQRSRWLNAVSVEADAAQLAAIAALPGVTDIQPLARRRGPAQQRARRGADRTAAIRPEAEGDAYGVSREQLEQLHIPFMHACGLTGAGVVVGMQDSGFSREHAALLGVDVIAAHDFLQDDDEVADQAGDVEGQHDHGTMMLSLLAGEEPGRYMGAAPGVSVILSKTEDSGVEAPFEEDRYVAGLEWSEAMGADLFTSSLGYIDWYAPADLDGATAVTSRAAAIAVEQGLIMFTSVGNAGPQPGSLIAPSDADGVIAVGAVDHAGIVAEFSSRGPTADGRIKPDIVAPGLGIWVVDPGSHDEYFQGDGTSIATPLAAGTAALVLEALPGLDPAALRALIEQAGSQADAPDNDVGHGLPDLRAALAERCGCADADGDGAFAVACGGTDCDDSDPKIRPGAVEVCNGHDDDCDGVVPTIEIDADDDGVLLCADDCDDADPTIAPDLPEICDDARDNDCDPRTDDAGVTCVEADGWTGAADEAAGAEQAEGCGCGASDGRGTGVLLLGAALLLALRRRR